MTPSIYRKVVTVDKNQAKGFGNMHRPQPCLRMFHAKEGARSLHISIKNHDIHTETGKLIYTALTFHSKHLFLKRDQSRCQKSAVYIYSYIRPEMSSFSKTTYSNS